MKFILLAIPLALFFSSCTVVVNDPPPRQIIVHEVNYTGSRPVDVYLYNGQYYYYPSSYISVSYHHQPVLHYRRDCMHVVRYQRAHSHTVIVKEPAPSRTVVIKESHREPDRTVVIKEPRREPDRTVIIKEPRREPDRTVIIKEQQREPTRNVIIREPQPKYQSTPSRSSSSTPKKTVIIK